MSKHVRVSNLNTAWDIAKAMLCGDFRKDEHGSAIAGYPIYRKVRNDSETAFYNYICDLGSELEVNLCDKNWNGMTVHIHFDAA